MSAITRSPELVEGQPDFPRISDAVIPESELPVPAETMPSKRGKNAKVDEQYMESVHRIPRRMKGCLSLRKVIALKERDLTAEFHRVHQRSPNYLEREIIEAAMNHITRAAGLARILDLDFHRLDHKTIVNTWERCGVAHDAYIEKIEMLKLDKQPGKLTFRGLMEATAEKVETANGMAEQEARNPSVIGEEK